MKRIATPLSLLTLPLLECTSCNTGAYIANACTKTEDAMCGVCSGLSRTGYNGKIIVKEQGNALDCCSTRSTILLFCCC